MWSIAFNCLKRYNIKAENLTITRKRGEVHAGRKFISQGKWLWKLKRVAAC